MEWDINNVSTIATIIWVSIISPILIMFGYSIDQATGVSIITGILTVIVMIWNASHPNTMEILGNQPVETETTTGVDDEP